MKKAVNIKWDTDGDKEILESLPTEIKIPDNLTDDEISDYISDKVGYCHYGFEIEETKTKTSRTRKKKKAEDKIEKSEKTKEGEWKDFNQVAKIKVFGVGGGGSNAVNRMIANGVKGVKFYIANTDVQVIDNACCKNKIVLGKDTMKGLGAGGNPECGKKAAEESESEIRKAVKDTDMVFITTGMGGGTGTGAAPLIAKAAKEEGALTVAVVTRPFTFEGRKRTNNAKEGIEELKKYVDSLIIVSNDNLLEYIGRKPVEEAFQIADNILRQGVQTISDLIAVPTLINLDFADVRSVMANRGRALIGIGMADGEDKATTAAEKAIQSPLLEGEIHGAQHAIINITGGNNVSLFDAQNAIAVIQDAVGGELDCIFGISVNEKLGDAMIVTVIATGFEESKQIKKRKDNEIEKEELFVEPKIKVPTGVKTTVDEEFNPDDEIPKFFFNR